jgi:hypothetical protein
VCEAALRSDGSGLLVSVSRGISASSDMATAARQLRDGINASREQATDSQAKKKLRTGGALLDYQSEFISFALANRVLQFGSFKLKSGRISPYFFNAGLFCTGQSLNALSRFYAKAIRQSGLEFDVIFGPAYKGIPLATAISIAWLQLYGESKDVSYNRKEVKDHGEVSAFCFCCLHDSADQLAFMLYRVDSWWAPRSRVAECSSSMMSLQQAQLFANRWKFSGMLRPY